MSPRETTIVVTTFVVVLVFCVTILIVATRIRRRKIATGAYGPGHYSVPAPTDPWRRFTSALTAPYGRVEARSGQVDLRNPVKPEQIFFGYAVPSTPGNLKTSLAREWGVTDAASATETIRKGMARVGENLRAHLAARQVTPQTAQERLRGLGIAVDEALLHGPSGQPEPDALAFDIARVANLVRWSAVAQYLDPRTADAQMDALGGAAVLAFADWQDFGARYRSRLPPADTAFAKAVDWLLTDAKSPWKQQPWPG
ncbi:DUF1266 domain-containing protein [Nannocystis punicea]|uniref:DUF1266 domain-containing protein n=1 Tax=Nannocystis punicea TaxID=2995304 RepID=A0ABY7GSR7_9BACT|nr:DUF1266 domain-containing protein [Nannocystis poenicansa]WAS89995.1 DUF1266 domain-containing protein [Nannocystis poenicansa]